MTYSVIGLIEWLCLRKGFVLGLSVFILATLACGQSSSPSQPSQSSSPSQPSGSGSSGCPESQRIAFDRGLVDNVKRFSDTMTRANYTPRIALSPVIGEMQAIKRDMAGLSAPTCAKETQRLFVAWMEQEIKTFNMFMSGDYTDGQVSAQSSLATDKLEEAHAALKRLGE